MKNHRHRVRDLLLLHEPERSPEFWPWLGPLNGKRATKKQANKFLLGCMVDYRKKSELVWRDVRVYVEQKLHDPDDLWTKITETPEEVWKTGAHQLRCLLASTAESSQENLGHGFTNRRPIRQRRSQHLEEPRFDRNSWKIAATWSGSVGVKDDRRRVDRHRANLRTRGPEGGHAHENGPWPSIRR